MAEACDAVVMILSHQPQCFPESVMARVSSRSDGTMLDRTSSSRHDDKQLQARKRFCEQNSLSYEDVVYQRIEYSSQSTYDILKEVSSEDTTLYKPEVAADALFTSVPGVGLFLPVADCVATVAYDPVAENLALLHLGRHSTLTDLVAKTITRFVQKNSKPEDIIVYMSPSAKKDSYYLKWFDAVDDPRWEGHFMRRSEGFYLDLPGYNRERWIEGGVLPENIDISPVDTVKDGDYFSHSTGDMSERFAIVAAMKPQ